MDLLTAKQQQEFNKKGITPLTESQYKKAGKEARAVWDSHDYTDRSRVQLLLFEDGSLIIAEWDLYPISGGETTEYALLKCGKWTLRHNIEATIGQHMPNHKLDNQSKNFVELARTLRARNR